LPNDTFRVNREKWFDDEASLSGDDTGSDLDDDDLPNEYEAEEGDADDVPDSDVIKRQNHKLLLKQENDRDYQELVRLQDRLLADGDLGSLETNRTFRLKLRESMDVEDIVEEDAELPNKERDEIISQASERRVSAIKWLMKHASFL
uniref:RNA polymerase-associated protein RTF1-like protein n=1 Tax=Angiostrongylus cantonensis TaxID=6313 RepID=A0A0K0CZV5_ANGCA